MTAVVIGYYVFAVGLIVGVGYFTGRRNNREMRRQTDEIIARMHAQTARIPPLEPYVREPLPDDEPDPDDEDTIAAVREQLAELADRGYPVAVALREVSDLARKVGI